MTRRRSARALASTLGAFLTVCACGESEPTVVPSDRAARIEIVSGDGQLGIVSEQLREPLMVRVTDRNGKPLTGVTIEFLIASGAGAVIGLRVASSDRNGLASRHWRLGTSTSTGQRLEARVLALRPDAPNLVVTFRATARPAEPVAITLLSRSADTVQRAASATSTTRLSVVDRFGNPIPGIAVAWSVAGLGSFLTPGTVTGEDGTTTNSWTVRSANGVDLGEGAYHASASAANVPAAYFSIVVGDATLRASSIASGANHSCAIVGSAGAYCWGSNDFGQIGDGSSESRPPAALRDQPHLA